MAGGSTRIPFLLFIFTANLLLPWTATAQRVGGTGGGAGTSAGYNLGTPGGINPAYCNSGMDCMGPEISEVQAEIYVMDVYTMQAQKRHAQQEQPSEGVSKLDLKAPGSARKEYQKGVLLLLHSDFNGAVAHLSKAVEIYSSFVAAHNSLGRAYMELGSIERARGQFAEATVLDDHLPNSFSNLCHAELALKHYAAARQAIKKATSLSPLDLDLLPTLVYADVMDRDFKDAIETAHKVHEGKHDGAAMVHFFAAAAWREEGNLPEMENELKTFLAEDPHNASAEKAKLLIAQIDHIRAHPPKTTILQVTQEPSEAMIAAEREEQKQIAEAKKLCVGCSDDEPTQSQGTAPLDARGAFEPRLQKSGDHGWLLRKSVDEVAVLFAATEHGKSVSDLTQQEVDLKDDHQPPLAVVDFRNQSQLPLRLGLVIDSSASIVDRFKFEQAAAASFLQKILVNKDDLAFVVGFSNTVLLVQDFTSDKDKISSEVEQLAPAGGTALWDAVSYAAEKLTRRVDQGPVAKILVVISDGKDNSSKATLKQAIQAVERGEVIVYTVSTTDSEDIQYNRDTGTSVVSVGDTAMRVLAQQSGGSAFSPGSVNSLKHSLAALQEVIRSRYLISYKPAHFQSDGRYRSIDISAQKSGHKLRVYARKGYYSRAETAENEVSPALRTP
jgi:Ca-activated chloride channel homolog